LIKFMGIKKEEEKQIKSKNYLSEDDDDEVI
jgi:hypothetical protein